MLVSSWRTGRRRDMWLDKALVPCRRIERLESWCCTHFSVTPTLRAVMWHFEPSDNSRVWALWRDIEAQQESLGYASPSRRHLQKLYVVPSLLTAIILPAPGARSEITSLNIPQFVDAAGPDSAQQLQVLQIVARPALLRTY